MDPLHDPDKKLLYQKSGKKVTPAWSRRRTGSSALSLFHCRVPASISSIFMPRSFANSRITFSSGSWSSFLLVKQTISHFHDPSLSFRDGKHPGFVSFSLRINGLDTAKTTMSSTVPQEPPAGHRRTRPVFPHLLRPSNRWRIELSTQ